MSDAPMSQRIVVLGASNVSRGLGRLVRAIESRAPAADLFVAAGHGRSYGANSRVWVRRLPSILRCGLWQAIDRDDSPARPLHAFVSDIGNDLLYGFSVDQTAAWVRESVRRLAERDARIVITRLPLASLTGVGEVRYWLLRSCFVPGCQLSLAAVKAAAISLDEAVVEIAAQYRATVIDQPGSWYGLDAIHVRRRHLDMLWERAGDAWGLLPERVPPGSLVRWAQVGSRAAEVRSIAGAMCYTPQPVLRLSGGGRVSLY